MLRPVLDPRVPSADPTERRRARLLATFLLILFLAFGAVDVTSLLTVPGYAPPWYGYLFLAGAWLLNRLGRYAAAAAVTLTMFPTVLLGTIASGGSPRDLGGLVYLVPGVLLASMLHSARGTALFSAASVATILLAPLLVPAASLRDIVIPLALVVIAASLAVVSILHRDRLEQDRQAELRDSEERLRLALEAAHMATWDWDLRSGTVRWSEGAERVFGVPEGGAPGTAEAYLALVHGEDREVVRQAVESALESGSRRYTVRHRVADREGAVRWLEAYGRVVRNGRGKTVRTRGAILDVTDRQRIEGQREKLIRELEAKNDELERFTYTVSHDLKSPLITIKGFLGLIAKDLADGHGERLGEDVARMTSAADGMQRLLHELLRLSRIGRIVGPSERVPFAEVVREAAVLVRSRLEERRVQVEIDDDLPAVHGDRMRLVEGAEPAGQRRQVPGRPALARGAGGGSPGRERSPVRAVRAGQRDRDRPPFPGEGLRPVREARPPRRGERGGAGHRPPHRQGPRWACLDRVGRPWPGHHCLLHPAPSSARLAR
jgi:PAS domain S-box-containing protein